MATVKCYTESAPAADLTVGDPHGLKYVDISPAITKFQQCEIVTA